MQNEIVNHSSSNFGIQEDTSSSSCRCCPAKCTSCRIMKENLEKVLAVTGDRLTVTNINVNKEESLADEFKIETIPTQVFLSPDGKELFRNVGMMSKDKILAKWKELDYDLTAAAPAGDGEGE